jgi:coenzyme F420-reducing hydrogenase gamma subunit
MRKVKRQKISERVGTIGFHQLCGCFDEVIKNLKELQQYYSETFPDATEIWISDNNWDNEFGAEFDVMVERMENDKEYNDRVKKLTKEKALKKQREQAEYETYLRLQKKFQGNVK